MSAIILDTETNGLKVREVVELAYADALIVDGRLVVGDVIVQRFRPSLPFETGAITIHGITPEDVAHCPDSSTAVLPPSEYVLGYNVDFDAGVMACMQRKRICGLALSRAIWPHFEKHTLSHVFLELCGTAPDKIAKLRSAHAADGDLGMLTGVFQRIIDVAKVQTIEELHELSEESRTPICMPGGKHKGKPLADVPVDYVRWMLAQPDVDSYFRAALEKAHPYDPFGRLSKSK